MSTTYGLAASRTGGEIIPVRVNTAGLVEGAIVMWDSAQAKGSVKAPTGAGVVGLAGVLVGQIESGGTASGSEYQMQISGICPVLLDAGQTVTVGNKVIASDTDGSGKALGTTDQCDVLGTALQTLTAGSANDLIMVQLGIAYVGDNVP